MSGAGTNKIISKLKDAPNTKEGLRDPMNNCKKLVRLLINEKKGDALMARCSTVLQGLWSAYSKASDQSHHGRTTRLASTLFQVLLRKRTREMSRLRRRKDAAAAYGMRMSRSSNRSVPAIATTPVPRLFHACCGAPLVTERDALSDRLTALPTT